MTAVLTAPPSDAALSLGEAYYRMAFIRAFEEALLRHFEAKELSGTTHTYIGQEATAVAALSFLGPRDFVCSQHRSHGYYIAAGHDPRALFLEILGDEGGVCKGLGGSQHLYTGNFLSNGIVGGIPGIATGLAFAKRLRTGDDGIVIAFIGDGTLGEGLTYESFNLAALWRVPIFFVIENNRYAQTTRTETALAGSIMQRVTAFGIPVDEIESNDVAVLAPHFSKAFRHVRSGAGPYCQIVNTYRMGPHSKGDDLRPEQERQLWQGRDPLLLAEERLGSAAAEIRCKAEQDAARATRMPEQIRAPSLASLSQDPRLIPSTFEKLDGLRGESSGNWMARYLNRIFADLLEEHSDLYFLGEDIHDPGGGAFKLYQGLSSSFPGRVIPTPISEAGIVAAAGGLALSGFRPVVEIMFGDFISLAFDQILNHATKFGRMYAEQAQCPLILRSPFGGYRGYGATHSQSLEKLFLGVAGLVVTASDLIHDQRLLWQRMLALRTPCLHVENKTLYGRELPSITNSRRGPFRLTSSRSYFPTTTLSLTGVSSPSHLTIIAYGAMAEMAQDAALVLFREHEILCNIVVPSQLAPLPQVDLANAVARSSALIILEEGTERAGFGAEVIASLGCHGALSGKRVARCAALDTIIPNSAILERSVLPSADKLIALARALCK